MFRLPRTAPDDLAQVSLLYAFMLILRIGDLVFLQVLALKEASVMVNGKKSFAKLFGA
jgi:hypothetical protein